MKYPNNTMPAYKNKEAMTCESMEYDLSINGAELYPMVTLCSMSPRAAVLPTTFFFRKERRKISEVER